MFANQNMGTNLELLRAMRYFYSKAKNIKTVVLIVSIVLPLVYMGYRYAKNVAGIELEYDALVISIGLVWILIMYFLEQYADKFIAHGAKAQEEFDVRVFDIHRNDVLILEGISEEKIFDGQQAFKGDDEALQNWYGEERDAPHYLKVLIAQRMNIIWGNELKTKYKVLTDLLIGFIALFAISIAFYFNMSFQDSLIFIVFPLIPLFYLSFKTSRNLNRQIVQNRSVDKKILHDCENFKAINEKQRCRIYQDYIYSENRIRSVLIPDWFYKLFKDGTNKKLSATNEKILEKYAPKGE
ncbi:MAG: hypothetical protein JXK05_09630 [Campylobacterales bacterium]|nr:hypothetical protein [Campylobacterales bacterium]